MADKLTFAFDGKLAAENRMDFYEVSRFQYAAARLAVKLDHFRRKGTFPKKVTREANVGVEVKPYEEGSFLIEVLAPVAATVGPMLVEVPLSALWTYVVERVFKPAQDDTIKTALETQNKLIEAFEGHIEGSDRQASETLTLLKETIERGDSLSEQNQQLYERLLAEVERRAYLEGRQEQLSQITAEQDAKLVQMAAPLLRELSVPLRRSATVGRIYVSDGDKQIPILSADRAMAEDVELTTIDPAIKTVLIDIIQYNKENGWGKFRNPEWEGTPSFSVPADRKERLRGALLDAMNQPEVYVAAYYVKTPEGINQRLIVVDVVDIEALEAGLPQKH